MSSLKCSFCGEGINYHGIPNGIEYVFFSASDWQSIEEENIKSDVLELEKYEKIVKAWKCPECGTFAFFNNRVKVNGVYTPKNEISTDELKKPIEFGVFFEDYIWDEITETDIPASEILKTFPKHWWIKKNKYEMRIFSDKEMSHCIAQYAKIEIAPDIQNDGY
jgi:hypothetical protein